MAFGRSSLAFALIHGALAVGCDSNNISVTGPPVVFEPPSERVANLLRDRHARYAAVRSVDANFTETREDLAWRVTTIRTGRLRYLHPNKGRIDFEGDEPSTLVFPGDGWLWERDPAGRRITTFWMGLGEDPLCDHRMAPVSFQWLLPVSPKRFDSDHELAVIEESETEIHLKGRHRRGGIGNRESVVTIERLVIDAKTLEPIKLVVSESNGNRITIEYTSIRTNPNIVPEVFAAKVPEGWKVVENPWKWLGL